MVLNEELSVRNISVPSDIMLHLLLLNAFSLSVTLKIFRKNHQGLLVTVEHSKLFLRTENPIEICRKYQPYRRNIYCSLSHHS